MNNIKFLLIGTSLSFIPNLTFAQCVATQDCETLGYTETSCNGGKGVKCPFGNKWACIQSDSECEQQFCDKYGFKYTCSGTGYAGGGGELCNNKYAFCTCASGYYWENGSCKQKTPDYTNCTIGALFYSDYTCSYNLENSKTLLGVVIMEKSANQNGWIMTVNPIQTGIRWSISSIDIPGLTNYASIPDDIQSSCSNTDIITAYGDSNQYPAAWAAKNYKPIGTPSNKSWCLPSGGLLNNINHPNNFTRINTGIITSGGKTLGNIYNNWEFVWSSSEYKSGSNVVWFLYTDINGSFSMGYTPGNLEAHSVRPVMEF